MEQRTIALDGTHQASKVEIPEPLVRMLMDIEEFAGTRKKIAVFDLDNTLLVGDIGEAVFAELKLLGYIPEYRWEDYRRALNSNRWGAYTSVVTAMSGLTERLIQRVTLDLISRRGEYLELEQSFIPVPYPHPLMQRLVAWLQDRGYQTYIVSASNEISARSIAWKMFGIPPFNTFGIRQRSDFGVLTDRLIEPIPIDQGKAEVFRKYVGETNPLVTAGDSYLDVPMLRLTDGVGLTIWVGEETVAYEAAQQRVGVGRRFFFVHRPVRSQVDEDSSDR